MGEKRLIYPARHIEVDNRLSWFLGRIDKIYGDDAYYVYLKRNAEDVARSFAKRFKNSKSIIRAFRDGILMREAMPLTDLFQVSLDYVETVNSNIELFLKDKSRKIEIQIEHSLEQGLEKFWNDIGAEGDYPSFVAEFSKNHNASK